MADSLGKGEGTLFGGGDGNVLYLLEAGLHGFIHLSNASDFPFKQGTFYCV